MIERGYIQVSKRGLIMNINEQVEKILANLGVEMEYAEHEQHDENSVPDISIFQSSRDHYGVFYRLDIIDHVPQLRIMMPVENGALKVEMYLVLLSMNTPLHTWFKGISSYHGSLVFERGREGALQHLLYAVAEMMKQLFWSGDLYSMAFPPEIDVRRLI
jgi:hypothetical protein